MEIYIDDNLAVELTKTEMVESDPQDWMECYRKFYPDAHIYYRGH